MNLPSTPNCCDVWPKIAERFSWFDLAVDGDVSVIPISVMPSLFASGEYWRVNYCPLLWRTTAQHRPEPQGTRR